MGEVTWVLEDVCVCNNCGAFAETEEKIKHHKTCQPGESKDWEKIYNKQEEEV